VTPTFSIITCTRNSIATLPDTLRSVQTQRSASFEQVFVDGDSTDGTLELLQRQPGEVRIVTGVRGGIARAMNAGVAAARGEFVAHLHADDYYVHPDVLATVERQLRADGSDWLFGRIVSDVGGQQVPEGFTVPRFSPRALLRRNIVPHPATFVRREVFARFGGFREDYRLAMDYEFWLRIAPHLKASQLDEPLAAFRVHEGSASARHAWASFREDFRARFTHAPLALWPEFGARFVVRAFRQFAGV
jgi:glycosyltransferase involved in cell wall biosynthesis